MSKITKNTRKIDLEHIQEFRQDIIDTIKQVVELHQENIDSQPLILVAVIVGKRDFIRTDEIDSLQIVADKHGLKLNSIEYMVFEDNFKVSSVREYKRTLSVDITVKIALRFLEKK